MPAFFGTADGRALQRNPFGWVEGQTNPAADAEKIVLRPSGAALVAVRVIRMAHELGNTDEPSTQERTIGGRADETWQDVTPLTSHVRTMNQRTTAMSSPMRSRSVARAIRLRGPDGVGWRC